MCHLNHEIELEGGVACSRGRDWGEGFGLTLQLRLLWYREGGVGLSYVVTDTELFDPVCAVPFV